MEVLLENDYCKLGFHKDYKMVFVKWKKFNTIEFEYYQKPYLIILDLQDKEAIENLVVDAKNQGVIPPHFRKWFQEEITPVGIKKGMKRAAFITNANIFKKYYINNIMNTTKKLGFVLKVFNSLNEGIAWIKTFVK